MSVGISQFTPSRRDSGLRRLRVANRVLAAVAIVLTLALAELAAHSFHGHARKLVVRSTPLPTQPTAPTRRHKSERDDGTSRVRHRHAVHTLRPPAQPPSSATTAASQPAQPAAPAEAQPAPAAPSPSTTVSGGS